MVAAAEEAGVLRVARLLRDMEVPGDAPDHAWMGRRIQEAVDKITDRFPGEYCQDLLVSGLVLDMGLDPARSSELEGCCFPAAWLESVPALMRAGFPLSAWRLVEAGLLTFEPDVADVPSAWRLDLAPLQAQTDGWYELGEALVWPKVVKGLCDLIRGRKTDTRVRIVAGSLKEARRWAQEVRSAVQGSGAGAAPLVVAG